MNSIIAALLARLHFGSFFMWNHKSLVEHTDRSTEAKSPQFCSVSQIAGVSMVGAGFEGGVGGQGVAALIRCYCGNSVTGLLCLRVSMSDRTPLFTLVETRRDTDSPGGEELQAF